MYAVARHIEWLLRGTPVLANSMTFSEMSNENCLHYKDTLSTVTKTQNTAACSTCGGMYVPAGSQHQSDAVATDATYGG